MNKQAAFDVQYNMGFVCVKLGQCDEAVDHFTQAIGMNTTHSDAFRGLAGVLYRDCYFIVVIIGSSLCSNQCS